MQTKPRPLKASDRKTSRARRDSPHFNLLSISFFASDSTASTVQQTRCRYYMNLSIPSIIHPTLKGMLGFLLVENICYNAHSHIIDDNLVQGTCPVSPRFAAMEMDKVEVSRLGCEMRA
jgi:hypothetical protein